MASYPQKSTHMNHLQTVTQQPRTRIHKLARFTSIAALTVSVTMLAACSSVSDLTKERVADSAVTVQQSEQTIGRSEDGTVELQRAKQSLAAAQEAVEKVNDKDAQRLAGRAELHARLAVAQAQSADARRAAEEILASTNALRKESERNSTSTAR